MVPTMYTYLAQNHKTNDDNLQGQLSHDVH
jgi:hypothetical protein